MEIAEHNMETTESIKFIKFQNNLFENLKNLICLNTLI